MGDYNEHVKNRREEILGLTLKGFRVSDIVNSNLKKKYPELTGDLVRHDRVRADHALQTYIEYEYLRKFGITVAKAVKLFESINAECWSIVHSDLSIRKKTTKKNAKGEETVTETVIPVEGPKIQAMELSKNVILEILKVRDITGVVQDMDKIMVRHDALRKELKELKDSVAQKAKEANAGR